MPISYLGIIMLLKMKGEGKEYADSKEKKAVKQ